MLCDSNKPMYKFYLDDVVLSCLFEIFSPLRKVLLISPSPHQTQDKNKIK